jgi:hypothetical protein
MTLSVQRGGKMNLIMKIFVSQVIVCSTIWTLDENIINICYLEVSSQQNTKIFLSMKYGGVLIQDLNFLSTVLVCGLCRLLVTFCTWFWSVFHDDICYHYHNLILRTIVQMVENWSLWYCVDVNSESNLHKHSRPGFFFLSLSYCVQRFCHSLYFWENFLRLVSETHGFLCFLSYILIEPPLPPQPLPSTAPGWPETHISIFWRTHFLGIWVPPSFPLLWLRRAPQCCPWGSFPPYVWKKSLFYISQLLKLMGKSGHNTLWISFEILGPLPFPAIYVPRQVFHSHQIDSTLPLCIYLPLGSPPKF